MRPLQRLQIERLNVFFTDALAARDFARLKVLRDELAHRRGRSARVLAMRVELALSQPAKRAA